MYQISLRWLACDSGNLFVAMQPSDPDVVIVGAGIAGASLATVLARSGLEVVLLERQREYSDRVRGEYMAMWGVLEARELGLEDVLASTGAVTARYSVPYDELLPPAGAEAAVRDMSTLLPGVAGALCASHPNACQALAEEAARSGAKVVSGVANVRVEAGTRPSVSFQNGAAREVRPRLVVGADGRTSTVRVQCGIEQRRAAPTHLIAGMLVEGVPSWPDDHYSIGTEGDLQFYVFPQGSGRVRLYTCQANDQAGRWAGADGSRRFLEAFAGRRSLPAAAEIGLGSPAGPCATMSGEDTWSDRPFTDGVVLIGDAAGYNDPVSGQGLSLGMRDVRDVSELLLASSDWSVAAFRPYGEERTERMRRMRRVAATYAALMTTFSDAGRARRGRFYGRMAKGDRDAQMVLAAVFVGPHRLPAEAFSEELHAALLA